jgi:hypothetical protein
MPRSRSASKKDDRQKVLCDCCDEMVSKRTRLRHRKLKAPVDVLASSPYFKPSREVRVRHLNKHCREPLEVELDIPGMLV